MRPLVIGAALFLAGIGGASAQFYGPLPPPPPYAYRPPPPYAYGYGYASPRPYWGPPPARCWYRPGPFGPERVCRRDW